MTTRLLAGLGLAGCLALASGCDILRISVAADGTSSDGLSAHPSLSADGRFVAFESSATNLAPGCSGSGFFNGESDGHIYLYDRNPNTTSCLTGPVAPVAEADFREPKLSANGAIVAFTAVTFNRLEVFVLDRPARQLTRVSVATDGTPADGRALDAALSADGRVVAFASDATNLDPRCVPLLFRTQIFVHERITGTTTCVSVAPDGTRGNNDSRQPALSADGRFVAFGSQATNLDPRCPGLSAPMFQEHVYVHDRGATPPTTTCVSVRTDGVAGDGSSYTPALSADGRLVAFVSSARNLVPGAPSAGQLYILDRATGLLDLVSASPGGEPGNSDSAQPALSADGRVVVFISRANNLDSACDPQQSDYQVFVHERVTRTTRCISLGADGFQGNRLSEFPAISADGRVVAFTSSADNLVTGDTSGKDVFVVKLLPVPGHLVTGAGAGAGGGHVRADGHDIFPYGPAFAGDTRVATCDFTGDGVPDVLTGPGPGGLPDIRIFDGTTGALLGSFLAYDDPAVTGGVHVACGDVTGDGQADIVVGANVGGIPTVRVFDVANRRLARTFAAYDAAFTAEVRVAVCDLTGDGRAEVVTAPGPGLGPEARAFDGRTGAFLGAGPVFDPAFTGGVYVACGDVTGDGRPDLVFSRDAGGPPEVLVVDLVTGQSGSFLPYDAAFRGGVRVAVCHLTGRTHAEIMTGAGPGGAPEVRFFDGQTGLPLPFPLGSFLAYDPAFTGGVYVTCAG